MRLDIRQAGNFAEGLMEDEERSSIVCGRTMILALWSSFGAGAPSAECFVERGCSPSPNTRQYVKVVGIAEASL
jgi:hypothetical protein